MRVTKAQLQDIIAGIYRFQQMPFKVVRGRRHEHNPHFISAEKYAHGVIQVGELGHDRRFRYKYKTRKGEQQ